MLPFALVGVLLDQRGVVQPSADAISHRGKEAFSIQLLDATDRET
jgi:hypothetical protein